MKKFKLLFATFALMAAAQATAQTVNEVIAKYNEAVGYIQNEQYGEAVKALESTISMGLDAGADASSTVAQAQKILPNYYFRHGFSLCRSNRMEEGLAALESAMQYAELYQDAKTLANARKLTSQIYTSMGATAFNNKDWGKAIEIFSKGYKANPTDTELGLYLAESYAESGDYQNGLDIYRQIASLESRHSRYAEPAAKAKQMIAYYQTHRAVEQAKAGNTDAAYELISDILSVDPTNSQAQLLRIQTAAQAQDWARIIEWGESAADAQSDETLRSDIYFLLGAAYQNTDNKAAAINAYRKVLTGSKAAEALKNITLLGK